MTQRPLKQRLIEVTRRRWLGYWFVVVNLVAIAFFALDPSVGARAANPPQWLFTAADVYTRYGKSDWILLLTAFVFFASHAQTRTEIIPRLRDRAERLRDMAFYVFVSVAGSGLSVNIIKRAIGRARPEHYADLGTFSFSPFAGDFAFESFPSGHSTTAGALAIALCLLMPRGRPVFLALGLWLASTRIIVGAHYPSDVIAGFAFGAASSVLFAFVFARRGSVFRINVAGKPVLKRPVPLKWKTRR